MSRRLSFLIIAAALVVTTAPAIADHDDGEPSPPNPMHRLNALTPKPPGTHATIVLQYGPYVVQPGSDLTRADAEPVLHDMFVIAARPAIRMVDGTEPDDDIGHIHHAHWIKPNLGSSAYYDWFFGTGEERTRGGGWPYMEADAENWNAGVRYGIPMVEGESMGFISMLHNKTSSPLTLWIEGRFEVVWGSRGEIRAATVGETYPDGLDFHPLTPVLHGSTFQVPRVGEYTYPLDLATDRSGSIKAGIGHIWTAPYDGTIVVGAGHLHPGGRQVVVSNLGSPEAPCGDTWLADPDGDGLPGQVIQRIQAYYLDDVFPSEEFQMGITKLGWRAKIRKGDRIAINGTYDATNYAYPDAMSFFGFYVDQEDTPEPGEECTATLVDQPGAPMSDVVMSQPNRPFLPLNERNFCGFGDYPSCDRPFTEPAKGDWTDTIHVAGFAYVPGDQGLVATLGAPRVRAGAPLTIINDDWLAGLVRHSITTCQTPCNGPYVGNYPFHDGVLDSGALGFTPVETYETTSDIPMVTLDTADLAPGLYTYFCRLHPFMRGSFWLEPSA